MTKIMINVFMSAIVQAVENNIIISSKHVTEFRGCNSYACKV